MVKLPPHPATLQAPKLPPHSATVQRRVVPFGVKKVLPPHAAMPVIQRAAESFHSSSASPADIEPASKVEARWVHERAARDLRIHRGAAAELATLSLWDGYGDTGVAGLAQDTTRNIYVAFSGAALTFEDAESVREVLRKLGEETGQMFVFLAEGEVYPPFAELAAQDETFPGCAEKKLLTYFMYNRIDAELGALSPYRVTHNSKAVDIEYISPCSSCTSALNYYWATVRGMGQQRLAPIIAKEAKEQQKADLLRSQQEAKQREQKRQAEQQKKDAKQHHAEQGADEETKVLKILLHLKDHKKDPEIAAFVKAHKGPITANSIIKAKLQDWDGKVISIATLKRLIV